MDENVKNKIDCIYWILTIAVALQGVKFVKAVFKTKEKNKTSYLEAIGDVIFE